MGSRSCEEDGFIISFILYFGLTEFHKELGMETSQTRNFRKRVKDEGTGLMGKREEGCDRCPER